MGVKAILVSGNEDTAGNEGTACPGQWLNHHPWKDLKDVWMWYLRAWVSGGLASAGGWLDLMIQEGFSNLNHSMIPCPQSQYKRFQPCPRAERSCQAPVPGIHRGDLTPEELPPNSLIISDTPGPIRSKHPQSSCRIPAGIMTAGMKSAPGWNPLGLGSAALPGGPGLGMVPVSSEIHGAAPAKSPGNISWCWTRHNL